MADPKHEAFWPQIQSMAKAGKVSDIENLFLNQTEEVKEHVELLRFAVRSLMFREWENKNLELLIQLSDKAIEKALEINEIDEANIICYNMSANLADCWNDGFKRTSEHFKKGLNYADRAIEFRLQLKKGPYPFSIAYWARGAHLFFLGQYPQAEESFSQSLKYAVTGAKTENKPTTISQDSTFNVLIAIGYKSLAQIAQGQAQGRSTYKKVIQAFEGMKTLSKEAKEDAILGLDQLSFVYSKLLTNSERAKFSE